MTSSTRQNSNNLTTELDEVLNQHQLTSFGFVKLEKPHSFEFYKDWIDQGYHGEMEYLKTHSPLKENHQLLSPNAKSAIVCTQNYAHHPEPLEVMTNFSPRTSLYAKGGDYHFWFKNKLKKITEELKLKYPFEEFVVFTDSSPVLERDLAVRAGLGWVGKNSCVIDPKKGSLFFIGEIYTSLEIQKEIQIQPDFCGKCQKCMEACPTGAIIEAKKIDATRCISYLTIESKKVPSVELQEKMNDWYFGCDICQTVCPWNQKAFKFDTSVTLSTEPLLTYSESDEQKLIEDLRFILTQSGKQLQKHFFGTPLMRAGSFGLKRNALIVIGNRRISVLKPEVELLLENEKLRELAGRTLGILESSDI